MDMALKGRGRPRKPVGEVRSCQYRVRLTTYEEFLLDELAYKLGISKADVLRKSLFKLAESMDLTE